MQTTMKRAFVSATAACALVASSLFAGAAALAAEGETRAADTVATDTAATGAPGTGATVPAPAEAAGTQKCEPVPGEFTMTAATLKWAIRDSFNEYIEKRGKPGKITPTDVTWADGVFTFKGTEGSFAPRAHEGVFKFAGSIHYTKHDGALDMTFSNFALKSKGRSVTINADVTGKDMGGKAFDKKDLPLGAVDFSGHTHEGSKTLFANAPVVFTAEGAEVFAGMYKAGEAMASMTGELDMTPKQRCQDDANSGSDNAGANAGANNGAGTDNNAGTNDDSNAGAPGNTQNPKGNVTDPKADNTQPKADAKGDKDAQGDKTDVGKGTPKPPTKGDAAKADTKAGNKVALAKTGSSAGVLVVLAASVMALGVVLRRRA